MRPLKIPTMLLLLGFILFFSQAFAEYYKYSDENGNTHYTDNISAVPENQRPNMDEYQEYQIYTDGTQDDSKKQEAQPSQQDETQKSDQAFTAADEQGAALFQKKQGFDKRYKTLIEEKKRLKAHMARSDPNPD